MYADIIGTDISLEVITGCGIKIWHLSHMF